MFPRTFTLGSFDFKRTLQSLTASFDAKSSYSRISAANFNTILIKDNRSFGHEIIHTFQHYDFMVVNTCFDKHRKSRITKSNTIKKLNKWVYNDLPNRFVNAYQYYLEDDTFSYYYYYYDNFFEYEANYFSNR